MEVEGLTAKWPLTKPSPPGSKLTSTVVAAICENLASGNYITTSCEAAGIGKRTYHEWIEKAERDGPDSAYGEFAALVERARAAAEVANVQIIKGAAATTWQAAAWLLERQYPERWGRRDHVYTSGDVSHRVVFQFVNDKMLEETDDDGDQDDND